MAFPLRCITPPASEPVSLAGMKLFLRQDSQADNSLISALITAARQRAEDITGRCFIPQQWVYALDAFPVWRCFHHSLERRAGRYEWIYPNVAQSITLPRGPLVSVDSIEYVDQTGTRQTLDPSAYQVDMISELPRIVPAFGQTWPVALPEMNALQIKFTVGETDATRIPAAAIQAIQLMVSSWYENRQDVVTDGTPRLVPRNAEALLGTISLMPVGHAGARQ